MKDRNDGSILVAALVLIVVFAGLGAALFVLNMTYSRASSESTDREIAYQAAQSGVAYYYAQLEYDSTYFDTNPAPLSMLRPKYNVVRCMVFSC